MNTTKLLEGLRLKAVENMEAGKQEKGLKSEQSFAVANALLEVFDCVWDACSPDEQAAYALTRAPS